MFRSDSHPHDPTMLFADEFHRRSGYRTFRPQGSGDWLLITTISGAGEFWIGEHRHELPPGRVVLFAAGAVQDYRTDMRGDHWNLIWAHFLPRPEWIPWLSRWPTVGLKTHALDFHSKEIEKRFLAAMRRTARLLRKPLERTLDFARNAFEEALLWAEEARLDGGWAQVDARVLAAMEDMAAHTEETFSIEVLAERAGISTSRLVHLFKAETGIFPRCYWERQQMERARQILSRTDATVAETAFSCGYEDPYYFSRRFKKLMGTSPVEWKRLRRGFDISRE
ncbi:helix-turn-helix domain-containing protein [Puniceicoccus vermicola]|uniref:Helix-turn-helix domain-containing protein n=1 Tax=Puniceicoccus vermicola TaxID=388746 RepID=A0A7X1AXA5_9BACT|nr:helix-turn-helix domain-containing protein [Puniceicoccus vermicola]MBC2601720.1 helix-turn-helix domain-containing protein [Puniceicoccus vermicola]